MIYFDEAGNSGDNLLDPGQPSYILLSHDFSAEECEAILTPLLRISKAGELHFKTIKKYASRRRALTECVTHELLDINRVYYYAADKKFMVVIHMVDQLAEKVLYENGLDIYKEGTNLATANILYIMGTQAWDKGLFDAMCSRFVSWVRSGSLDDRVAFYNAVLALSKVLPTEQDHDLLNLILFSARYVNEIEAGFGKYSLDPTLSVFVDHCNHWAKRYGHAFDITVDDSKQLDYWDDMIGFLTRELPEAEVGYGSRKHKYPLLINSIQQASSHSSIQIQLADILASSLNHIFIHRFRGTNDAIADELYKTKLVEVVGNSMQFSTAVTPEDLNMTDPSGQNPLDFIAKVAEEKPEKFEKARRMKKDG